MNDYIFISDYVITFHCRRRWKKRWLDFTPKNEPRIKEIEEIIMGRMYIIQEYPERGGTIRVTNHKYEFVVDPIRKIIITMNAYNKVKREGQNSKKFYKRRKKYDEALY